MAGGTRGSSFDLRGGPNRVVNNHALALHAIYKRFGATQALVDASLTVRPGTVHAVLGENGAGKSTLMRIAFGMVSPDAGGVSIDDASVVLASSADAIARGLGMVHQHFTLVPAMTVAENVALGGSGFLDLRHVTARVLELAGRTGLSVDPTARVATLDVGAQQRVEILKALYGKAHTLILDEPTAVLTPTESDELLAWLTRFAAEGGTVVLVTHKLHEALAVASDFTVLRRGQSVLSARRSGLDINALVRAATGDDSEVSFSQVRRSAVVRGPCVARLDAAEVRDARGVVLVHPATIECFAGEIVGIAGVEGSGVHELLRLLAGRLTPTRGERTLPKSIGFVPEDRLRDALIEEFTLVENFALRGAVDRVGRIAWPAIVAQTAGLMRRHDVRALSPETRAGTLSGGNQQKFVVGRELDETPALIVAENPVRGLDIRATEHVMRELAAAATTGSAVVVYSADVDELLLLADRLFVMFAGRLREVSLERSAVASALVGLS
jgi:ABC-type uncharacterized transport system ATPase subunit